MNRWWIPALVLAAIVAAGCSKDEGPTQPPPWPWPPQPKNYMPLAVGNWWVYSRVELDTNGNVQQGTERRDSVVVVDVVDTTEDEGVYVLVSHDQGRPREIRHVALRGSTLYYRLYTYVDSLFDLDWISVHFFAKSWHEWSSLWRENVELKELEGLKGSLAAHVQLNGRRVGSEQVLIRERNQTVQAEKFQLKLSIDGDFEPQEIKIPLRFERTVTMWFAENIGLVAERTEEIFTIQPPPPLPPQRRKTGEARTLLNYWVQQ